MCLTNALKYEIITVPGDGVRSIAQPMSVTGMAGGGGGKRCCRMMQWDNGSMRQ